MIEYGKAVKMLVDTYAEVLLVDTYVRVALVLQVRAIYSINNLITLVTWDEEAPEEGFDVLWNGNSFNAGRAAYEKEVAVRWEMDLDMQREETEHLRIERDSV